MPHAVQISAFGSLDNLENVKQVRPERRSGEVVVEVGAAGTNYGEIMIREGFLKDRFPMPFPFGQGTDFAGRIVAVGADVPGAAIGDEVLGFAHDRSAQSSFVRIPVGQVVAKPPSLDWYRSRVRWSSSPALQGGVGALATQLAVQSGARVLAVASSDTRRS